MERVCSKCIHGDVCKYLWDPEIGNLVEAIQDRVDDLWDGQIDTGFLEDGFYTVIEEAFAAKCKEFSPGGEHGR